MNLNIVAVGEKSPEWIQAGVSEYLLRMPRECKVNLITVAMTKRTKNISILKAQEQEQALLLKNTPTNSFRIALDEHGKMLTTAAIATKLEGWLQHVSSVTMYIGGPDGFTKDFLNQVDMTWSLSSLTMPHMLVRLVLVEQLYRAWTVTQGHPYHRE